MIDENFIFNETFVPSSVQNEAFGCSSFGIKEDYMTGNNKYIRHQNHTRVNILSIIIKILMRNKIHLSTWQLVSIKLINCLIYRTCHLWKVCSIDLTEYTALLHGTRSSCCLDSPVAIRRAVIRPRKSKTGHRLRR